MTAVRNKTKNPDLQELVREHQDRVWRYLRFLGADATEVEDLVQETFLAVWRSDFEHRSSQQSASYMRTVARNQFLSARRRHGREPNMVELDVAESVWATYAEPSGGSDYVDAIEGCVEHLQGRARQVIDLQYRDGTSRADIAIQLEMTPDGVKTLLRRTREKLRQCVERKLNEL